MGDHVYNFALDICPRRPGPASRRQRFRAALADLGRRPAAGQYLILAGKARALMHGRLHVMIEDLEAVAAPVLRHRIIANFNAEAEGITMEQIIDKILALIPRGKGERLL